MQRAGTQVTMLFASLLLQAAFSQPSLAVCDGPGCYCQVSTTAVSFGAYDALSKLTVDSTGLVNVSCGADAAGALVSYDLALSTGWKGKSNQRELSGTRDVLEYNLYTNSSRSIIWGDGTNSSVVVTDSFTLSSPCCENRNYTVYGRINPGQNVRPGLYSDVIVVTVSY